VARERSEALGTAERATAQPVSRPLVPARRRISVAAVVKHLLAALVLLFFLFPVYWLVITAFKYPDDWFNWPPRFFTTNLTLVNFVGGGGFHASTSMSVVNALPYMQNSIIIAAVTAVVGTALAAMTAYAVSRFKVGGAFFANWIISLRMIPPIATALPLYLLFRQVGLLNTLLGMILAHLVFTVPLSTWILISFFNEIPRELDEAAFVDGASPFTAFTSVVLPLAAPGLAAVATLAFIASWGELLMALVLTTSQDAQTLPIFLGRFIGGFRVAWGPLAASGIITMLPVVLFSLLMQRYLIRGLTLGAVK